MNDVHLKKSENILHKVLPKKVVNHYGKKGKLRLRYIAPFEIINEIGFSAYSFSLPFSFLKFNLIFHVPMLIKYHRDGYYLIHWKFKLFDKKISYEDKPITILNRYVSNL